MEAYTLNDPTVALVPDPEQHRWGGLAVDWTVEGRHLVVSLSGEVDAANADALHDAIVGALGRDTSVRVDIGAVTFLDSSLLRALLICQARLAVTGVDLKVRNPTAAALRIFEITDLTSLLEAPPSGN